MLTKLFWNVAWLFGVLVTAYCLIEAFLPEPLQLFPSSSYPEAGFIFRILGIASCLGWYFWTREEKPSAEL